MIIFKKAADFIFGNYAFYKRKNKRIFDEAIKLDKFKVKVGKSTKQRYTDTLLVSCVDFRFRREVEELMSDFLHLETDYDEITLPGGSLSLVENKYPDGGGTTEEVIGILKTLHHIKRVIFLDHRNCGAYKNIKGKEYVATRAIETKTHRGVFKKTRIFMKEHFPELAIYTFLMDLDGVVENIKD
jgi:hypothetical protein